MLSKLENYTLQDIIRAQESRTNNAPFRPAQQQTIPVADGEAKRLLDLVKANEKSNLVMFILRGISGSGK
jgi:hypothetical protein